MRLRIIPDIVNDQKLRVLSKQNTAREAAKQMAENDIAAIVVTGDGGKLLGIVTERDLTRRVIAGNRDADKVTVGEIMTGDPDTLAPGDSALDALELMGTRKYRHLPVVDDGRIVGMVSIRDLYAAVKTALEKDIRETEAFVFGDRYGA
ncbi:MAG: CBS domain-containing protein [Alphaproteobacteria bacterium]|nr:CBS domain-containing protein [Alphaproteobacteria bacterium]